MLSLFRRSRKDSDGTVRSFYQSLYPEEIRYALGYKGAKMGKFEMRVLLDRYPYEALYLVTKALADNREALRAYLEVLTRLFVVSNNGQDELRDILSETIGTLPDGTAVSGAKLAQLNRSGSGFWQQAFRNMAQQIHDEDPTALPCLIAYTTMLGYRHFVDIYKTHRHAHITILVPEWMLDTDETMMGFEIVLNPEPSVIIQQKNMCLFGTWACAGVECRFGHRFCGNSVFVDDTIHTGATAGKIRSFWHSQYGLQIAPERVRVITDLRS